MEGEQTRNQWMYKSVDRKWGWLGHTLRKPVSNITRRALTWNPQGKRKRGRPRNTWRREMGPEMHYSGHRWKELE